MPDTPDFEKTARALIAHAATDGTFMNEGWREWLAGQVIEQLRAVWNARGAADLVKIEAELTSMMGGTASGPYVKNLDRAIRRLDR